MKTQNAQPIKLADYQPPAFLVDKVELHFDIQSLDKVIVHSTLHMRRNPQAARAKDCQLQGDNLSLDDLAINGVAPVRHTHTPEGLTLHDVPDNFILTTRTTLDPSTNKAFEGLYASDGALCTQCEAEGFRRITFFPDRPDVLATYTVTITAPPNLPTLLSNGNETSQSILPDGRKQVVYTDPHPKPCYLFALVAGDLAVVEDDFTTSEGRKVKLRVFADKGRESQCSYALDALKRSMLWDEQVYGRAYDLNEYNIVAVDFFNMGAMENKGLNIFNSKYVLASEQTATDSDYDGVESVIAHEYFHNWTGNRVTLRDWFQLSLKEGLTVFRDQEFSADMRSRALKRIQDVVRLRQAQFKEDASPMAHPVRPAEYLAIDNFYTATIYEKGAELLRMLHTLLGEKSYRAGTDLYFQRHDGQAVRIDEFVQAMSDASGRDLTHFMRWYDQAGTPEVTASGHYDAAKQSYTLILTQMTKPTQGQPQKLPLLIPVKMGLIAQDGSEMQLQLAGEAKAGGTSRVLELTQAMQSFTFVNVPSAPVPSLFRDFSAPIKLHCDYTDAELRHLLAHDSNGFNRWEAAQMLSERMMRTLYAKPNSKIDTATIDAFKQLLADYKSDAALVAEALSPPQESQLAGSINSLNPDALATARLQLRTQLAQALKQEWLSTYQDLAQDNPLALDGVSQGRRALRNLSLSYLQLAEPKTGAALATDAARLDKAQNMTITIGGLAALAEAHDGGKNNPAIAAFDNFAQKWGQHPVLVTKWLQLQTRGSQALSNTTRLMQHPLYQADNPNHFYALIGGFSSNFAAFHALDGSGYQLVADAVLARDAVNPQVAARLATRLIDWQMLEPVRQKLLLAQLRRMETGPLSPNMREIIGRALKDAPSL